MKKKVFLSLVSIGILALAGCGEYAEFTLIEDDQEAEQKFEEAKSKNEDADDYNERELESVIIGSYTEDEEVIDIDTTLKERIGIEDSRYYFDLLVESNYGTCYSYTRYNSTDNLYYDYINLNFTYESDGTEINFNGSLMSVNDDYDPTVDYDREMIDTQLGVYSLASVEFSDDIEVYTNADGYYKIEINDDEYVKDIIIDDSGHTLEMSVVAGDVTETDKINYQVEFDEVLPDDYEEKTFEEQFQFLFSVIQFYSLSFGEISLGI